MKSAKLWGTILGVLVFMALIAGITYAWYTWKSPDTDISGSTGCFNINYTKGQEIGGSGGDQVLAAGDNYTSGLHTTVKIGISSDCNIKGKGTLYLTTNTTGTSDAILKGALKYQVIKGDAVNGVLGNENEVANGTIDKTGATTIYSNFDLSNSIDTYTVYVWLDKTLVNESYSNATYSGYIHASATQDKSQT